MSTQILKLNFEMVLRDWWLNFIFELEILSFMNIFWFRRDLRLKDNLGLLHALNSGENVVPIFIFDENILSQLPKDDARVTFIGQQLEQINKQLNEIGKSLAVFHGNPLLVFKKLISEKNWMNYNILISIYLFIYINIAKIRYNFEKFESS